MCVREFYDRIRIELSKSPAFLWSETVCQGQNAGEKRLYVQRRTDESPVQVYPEAGRKQESREIEKTQSDRTIEWAQSGREAVTIQDGPKWERSQDGGNWDVWNGVVYKERIKSADQMVICGAGHVSMPMIRMGRMLGFTVTAVDDRPLFADHARREGADQVICQPFRDALDGISGSQDTWFIIVTRGHRYDTECLESIIKKENAYVGMMGSRKRTVLVKKELEQRGIDRVLLDRVHTPIGLSIGAQTPEEIAVSVMAEIIQIRNERGQASSYSGELLELLSGTDEGEKESLVLATIISKKGSAPRGVGTKMLIFPDGRTFDTIGGGCVESEVIQKGLQMLRTGCEFQVFQVHLSSSDAEDEGMVCGGTLEIMMEQIR